MSGTSPIQPNSNVVIPPVRTGSKSPEAASTEAPPADVFTQAASVAPAADEKKVITVRMAVNKELFEPDPQTGEVPLEKFELDLVPKSQTKTANAPVFIDAIEDPAPVEGYVAKSTVALVAEHLNPSSPEFHQSYFPTFAPKDGYVLTQQEVDNYTEEQQQIGFERGQAEGIEKGKKEAVPPGFVAKLKTSEKGGKLEQRRDMLAGMMGMVGSTSGALGIAANLGIPAQYAGPLALATAPLQILGPTGTLTQMAKLEDQKAALLESVAAENPDKDPLTVVVDMDPHTQKPITAGEALRSVDVQKKTQKAKTLGALLLAGAGVAAVGGWGTAATVLAVGSLASPMADAIPTFDKIGEVRDRKKELQGMLASGQEKVQIQVPVFNEGGVPIGFKDSEVPVQEALDHVNKQQKLLALGALGAVTQAGTLVAMGLGAPILMVVGASVALPLLARGALFPAESWETLKSIPGKVWDGIKNVATALGRKVGLVKDDPQGPPAQPMTEAQKQLFNTIRDIEKEDPKLAEGLKETLDALRPPQNEAEQKAAIAAGVQHQEQLKQLQEKYPELAARFESSVQGVMQEGMEQLQQAQFEMAHDQVESAVQSEFSQSLLKSDRVQSALRATGKDQDFAEGVVRMMAQAEIFGNPEVLLSLHDDNADARKQQAIYQAIAAELQERAQAGTEEVAASSVQATPAPSPSNGLQGARWEKQDGKLVQVWDKA